MVSTAINVDSWASLTALVNEMKSPASFLKNLLFPGQGTPVATEFLEWGLLMNSRDMAPFTRKDAEAEMVGGVSQKPKIGSFPNIRIKRPMTASELLSKRTVNSPVHPSVGQLLSEANRRIALDAQHMEDLIANREEWMIAQMLRGSIAYSAADGDHWSITFDKPNTHETTTAAAWATASTTDPMEDFTKARQLMDEAHGLQPTVAIMDPVAAKRFRQLKPVRDQLDNRRLQVGSINLGGPVRPDGAIYIGTYDGIDCYEYTRSLGGSTLIRQGYVEFVCASPGARMELFYGPIHDIEALENRQFVGRRFSKSWVEKDPPVRQMLIHTRPVPVMFRPGAVVSMDTDGPGQG